MNRDYKLLHERLKPHYEEIVRSLIPDGKKIGKVYMAGSIGGGEGDSFKFDLETGVSKDFANGEKGFGDVIALFQHVSGGGMSSAYDELNERFGIFPSQKQVGKRKVGEWTYYGLDEKPIMRVARYDLNGVKSYSQNRFENGTWVFKAPIDKRPLYGLEKLASWSGDILLVEGEKCVDSIGDTVLGNFLPMTWPGGAKAECKVDFSPIYGRNVTLWPDNDSPGIDCMARIAKHLSKNGCSIKIFSPPADTPKGWDAADWVGKNAGNFENLKELFEKNCKNYDPPDPTLATVSESDIAISAGCEAEVDPGQSLQMPVRYDQFGLMLDSHGKPIGNAANVVRILKQGDFVGHLWFDSFYNTIFSDFNGKKAQWSDKDTVNLLVHLQNDFRLPRLTKTVISEGVLCASMLDTRNEPRQWLLDLEWDRENRLEGFLENYFGCAATEYNQKVGLSWMVSLANRILNPGCKVDQMVVLESPEGWLKSTAIEVLADPWYVATHESVTNKDFYMQIQGHIIIEIEELDSFTRTFRERETIKAAISRKTDKFRPPYGHLVQEFPRQCIFVGTTNKVQYLHENTGLRRFLPVKVGSINLKALRRDRDQIFAEARELCEEKYPYWQLPHGSREQQSLREEHDAWQEIVSDWLRGQYKKEFSTREICAEALKIEVGKISWQDQRRIGKVMRQIGAISKSRWIDGEARHCFTLPNDFLQQGDDLLRQSHFPDDDDKDGPLPY
jgi:hypothetical protein